MAVVEYDSKGRPIFRDVIDPNSVLIRQTLIKQIEQEIGAALITGVITEYASALWDPIGRIHWAGTETSTAFNGAIEGAVLSGERAASEAIKAEN